MRIKLKLIDIRNMRYLRIYYYYYASVTRMMKFPSNVNNKKYIRFQQIINVSTDFMGEKDTQLMI